MAKSDRPLTEIKTDKAFTKLRKANWAGNKQINGFDTETADGKIFAISYAFSGYRSGVEADPEFIDSKTIWDLLTNKRARNAHNVWYNLDFDANVILKSVLDKEELAVLTVSGSVETDEYSITYIPGKFLKIDDDSKHVYYHYDVAQFFYTSLDNAAEEWLDRNKVEEIDAKKFGKSGGKVNDYVTENWDKILEYAEKDAKLVCDLWKEAVLVGESLDIPMGKPFSTGFLAESYLHEHLDRKPGHGPHDVMSMAWDAYAGGRFEVFKRGNIGPVAGPDINSAYPWILSNLPDPSQLRWQRFENPSIDEIDAADYGFIRADVTTDESRPIQPFAVKSDFWGDVVKYPALKNYEVTTLKEIFSHAYHNDLLTDYNIQEAWLGYEQKETSYPFGFVEPMYDERKALESDGYKKKGLLLKIILNSMYGKMCQTTPKRKELNDEYELKDGEYFVGTLSLPKYIREGYQDGFIEWLESGSFFNPFMASYITGMTRLELFKRVSQYGLENNVVMMATDCLMIEKGPFEESGFANDLVKSGLGNWDYDYAGHAFVIGAGVYEVVCKDGLKTQTRGFRETDLPHGLQAEAMKGEITVENTRPQTVAETLWSNQPVADTGVFKDFERKISADMDSKRRWKARNTSIDRLLKAKEESLPLLLSENGVYDTPLEAGDKVTIAGD